MKAVNTILVNALLEKFNDESSLEIDAVSDIFKMISFLNSIQLTLHPSDIDTETFIGFASIIEVLSELGLLLTN